MDVLSSFCRFDDVTMETPVQHSAQTSIHPTGGTSSDPPAEPEPQRLIMTDDLINSKQNMTEKLKPSNLHCFLFS